MAVRRLVHIGEPVLRVPTTDVAPADIGGAEVQGLIDDLIDTMRDAGGAGIAAPQIGVSLRVAVVEVDEHTRRRYPYKPAIPLTVMINPRLTPLAQDGTAPINEGCLSVPGIRGVLPRWTTVRVQWLDRDGVARDEVTRGLTAGTFQHECDHLDGMVFIDSVRDPTSFMTWENYDRFHRGDFEAWADAYVARVGQ